MSLLVNSVFVGLIVMIFYFGKFFWERFFFVFDVLINIGFCSVYVMSVFVVLLMVKNKIGLMV